MEVREPEPINVCGSWWGLHEHGRGGGSRCVKGEAEQRGVCFGFAHSRRIRFDSKRAWFGQMKAGRFGCSSMHQRSSGMNPKSGKLGGSRVECSLQG